MDINKWRAKNATYKHYAHFDARVSLNDVWDKVTNPDFIKSHGFYPLIKYTKHSKKYTDKSDRKFKVKDREICYSAHIDRCIFQYYSYLLNERYNQRVKHDNIDMVAVAYRNELGLNNIHFSKIAYDKIRSFSSCYIIVGDFTDFFGSLDHLYLKKMICNLLDVKKLPDNYYTVFKNITKYSTWALSDLLKINGLKDTKSDREKLNQKRTVITPEEFKRYKKKRIVQNKNSFGIPQGTAISAVLANVYMLEADKTINEKVIANNGLYMRYSDDFIIVIPKDKDNFKVFYDWLFTFLKKIPNVKLSPEKTKIYHYSDNAVMSCNSLFQEGVENSNNIINFLGFSFNGKEVCIRASTISKYYNKMYRKARTIRKRRGISYYGNKISCKNLYQKYSVKGAIIRRENGKKNLITGNFLTYVYRANKIYRNNEPIMKHTKHHMFKIHKAIYQNKEPS